MNNITLVTTEVPINDLIMADYNPRHWSDKAIRDLTKSIKDNGFLVPALVNSNKSRYGILIAGHFRVKIAKDLGYKSIPVNFIDIDDIEKEKRLNLTLNRVNGDWDYELLKNFDIELLLDSGFDEIDFTHIFDDMLGIEDDYFDVGKALATSKVPRTKLGDLIILGNHRLICGDATNPEIVRRLVGNNKVDMLNYDPIYNIGLSYDKGINTNGKYGGKTIDKKSESEYKDFLKIALLNGLKYVNPDLHVFTWCDETYIGLLQSLYSELGITNRRVCLWIKNNSNVTPQIAFNKAFEPCIYGTIGNPYLSKAVHNFNEVLNKEVGTGNRLPDDIMDLFNIWLVKRVNAQDYQHPTQKPPSLYEKALRRCSRPGDTILDLFGGSGSLIIGAEQLKRRALLCEISPIFCDVIVARYQALSGKQAKYVNTEK